MIDIFYSFTVKLKKSLLLFILTSILILIVFDYCIQNAVKLYTLINDVKSDNLHSEMYNLKFYNKDGKEADLEEILDMNLDDLKNIYSLLNKQDNTSTMVSYFSYQGEQTIGIIDNNYYEILINNNKVKLDDEGNITCNNIYIETGLIDCSMFENTDFFPLGKPKFIVSDELDMDNLEVTSIIAFMLIDTDDVVSSENNINAYLKNNNLDLNVNLVTVSQIMSKVLDEEFSQKDYVLRSLIFPIVLVLIGLITLVIKTVNLLRKELSIFYMQGRSKLFLYLCIIIYIICLWLIANIFNIAIGFYDFKYAYMYAIIQLSALIIGSILGYLYTNFGDVVTVTKEVD